MLVRVRSLKKEVDVCDLSMPYRVSVAVVGSCEVFLGEEREWRKRV